MNVYFNPNSKVEIFSKTASSYKINTMRELEKLLDNLETKIPDYEKINEAVSQVDVGWHIEHSLLVINSIIKTLANSNPKDYQWKFSLTRILFFTLKKFPRGKAKSPKAVRPKGDYDAQSLSNHLLATREQIKELKSLDKDKFFKHPIFGELKLQKGITFMAIHTKHHLYIIHDILK